MMRVIVVMMVTMVVVVMMRVIMIGDQSTFSQFRRQLVQIPLSNNFLKGAIFKQCYRLSR